MAKSFSKRVIQKEMSGGHPKTEVQLPPSEELYEIYRSLPNDNKISDDKIRKFSKFCCHEISQVKSRFWTIFRKFSPSPTSSKTLILLVYCRFGVSEI